MLSVTSRSNQLTIAIKPVRQDLTAFFLFDGQQTVGVVNKQRDWRVVNPYDMPSELSRIRSREEFVELLSQTGCRAHAYDNGDYRLELPVALKGGTFLTNEEIAKECRKREELAQVVKEVEENVHKQLIQIGDHLVSLRSVLKTAGIGAGVGAAAGAVCGSVAVKFGLIPCCIEGAAYAGAITVAGATGVGLVAVAVLGVGIGAYALYKQHTDNQEAKKLNSKVDEILEKCICFCLGVSAPEEGISKEAWSRQIIDTLQSEGFLSKINGNTFNFNTPGFAKVARFYKKPEVVSATIKLFVLNFLSVIELRGLDIKGRVAGLLDSDVKRKLSNNSDTRHLRESAISTLVRLSYLSYDFEECLEIFDNELPKDSLFYPIVIRYRNNAAVNLGKDTI